MTGPDWRELAPWVLAVRAKPGLWLAPLLFEFHSAAPGGKPGFVSAL